MGLDINAVQFLIAAREKGVRFDKTVTLGRQSLSVFPRAMAEILDRHRLPSEKFKTAGPDCAFAEPFFKSLGATRLDSLDHSHFEGASLIHDLNEPISPLWKEQFNVVFDGGTLEHVFNFPVALRNSMELLTAGGRLFIHTCANNLCGHGFYQFSPELFYRALSPENGFEVERIVIHRVGPYGKWREVADPNAICSRVELITFTPMHLLVQAKRTAIKEIFSKAPQQSDYTVMWRQTNAPVAPVKTPRFARVAGFLNALKTGLEFYRRQSLGNRRFFRPARRED